MVSLKWLLQFLNYLTILTELLISEVLFNMEAYWGLNGWSAKAVHRV
jgi:hypothetical protein